MAPVVGKQNQQISLENAAEEAKLQAKPEISKKINDQIKYLNEE